MYSKVFPENVAAGPHPHSLKLSSTYRGSFSTFSSDHASCCSPPLNQVLTRRDVKFEFFHQGGNIGLSQDKLRSNRSRSLSGDHTPGPYDPLIGSMAQSELAFHPTTVSWSRAGVSGH